MSFARDLGFALRGLKRHPVYAATAVATLGAGVIAATMAYAVVYGLLLAPPPYRDPDRLVALRAVAGGSGAEVPISVAEYVDLRRALVPRIYSELALFRRVEGNLTGGDEPDRITSQGVTGDFFH